MHDDGRSKKIALLAHCLLNQQAKVVGLARYPAQAPRIADILDEYGYSIIQMPCPEMYAAGLNRWGQVREQYNCFGYRKTYRQLAEFVVDGIMDYAAAGYEIVLLAIDGSPSCGVTLTESNADWGGSMVYFSEITSPLDYVPQAGVFIELLQEVCRERGIAPLRALGLPLDTAEGTVDEGALREFLLGRG